MPKKSLSIFKLLLFTSIIWTNASVAQNDTDVEALLEVANGMYKDKNYLHALYRYEILDTLKPNDEEIQYALAVSYIDVFLKIDKATQLLKNVLALRDPSGDIYYYLGKSYHLQNELDSAKKYYEASIAAEIEPTVISRDEILRNIEMCNNAVFYLNHMLDTSVTTIRNIGNIVNTEYSEYVPVVSADKSTLIFTYRGPGCTGGLQNIEGKEDDRGFYYEDVFIAYSYGDNWTIPVNISETVNTTAHDAVTSITDDEKTLLVYRNDGVSSDIMITTKDKKKNDWTKPKKLSKAVNTEYYESHATLSGDGNEIYFVSDKPGGFGGLDIYRSKKDEKGKWGEPENLGENINTPYDEEAPFIYKKGNVLYFSSKGHNSMGGYDIFRSIDFGGEWTKPQNMAYPINTTDDDLYFSVSPDGKMGYFGSKRQGGYGLLDIYTVNLDKLSLPFFSGEVDVVDYGDEEDTTSSVNDALVDSTDLASNDTQNENNAASKQNNSSSLPDNVNINELTPNEVYNMLLKYFGNKTFNGFIYKVQLGAYESPQKFNSIITRTVSGVTVKKYPDGLTRFFTEEYSTMNTAHENRLGLNKNGIPDAFIVGFYNGQKLFIEEILEFFMSQSK